MLIRKSISYCLLHSLFILSVSFEVLAQSKEKGIFTEINQAKEVGDQDKVAKLQKKLAEKFSEEGDYKKALKYYRKYTSYQNTLLKEKIERLETKVVKLNAKDEGLASNYIIGTGIFLLLAFFVYLYISNQQRKILNDKLKTKNVEARLQKKEVQLQNEQLLKLDAEKNDTMRSVAHDLKAPLNRVMGLSELILMEEERLSLEQVQYLSLIKQVANDGRKMIQNWLDIKAIEAQSWKVKWEHISVRQIIEDLVQGYKGHLESKNISITSRFEDNIQSLRCDRSFLTRILDNLISNAIKFSPKNTGIEITVSDKLQFVVIAIKDEGQGISKEDKSMLFQKFQKLSAKPTAGESSSGLGLSIVKMLLDRLNGEIEVESTVGKGAKFIVKLPKS